MQSHVLHIAGRKDSHVVIELPLPPLRIVLVDDVNDVSWVDAQLVTLIGFIGIEHLALAWGGGRMGEFILP